MKATDCNVDASVNTSLHVLSMKYEYKNMKKYLIASYHLIATGCNAYTCANKPVLFLTVLCALFVLFVHMYCRVNVQLSHK